MPNWAIAFLIVWCVIGTLIIILMIALPILDCINDILDNKKKLKELDKKQEKE